MICELCGKQLMEGFKVNVEGSIITACASCSIDKKVIKEAKKPVEIQRSHPVRKVSFDVSSAYDLVDDYGSKIKSARERKKMTQDDLGKVLNESHSLVNRVELEKFEPATELAKKIERALGIKILVAHKEATDELKATEKKEMTLGDLIVVRKKER